MISVKINGVLYRCVSTLTPVIETEYDYDVITLDGKRHRKFKGTKTNYNIVFYNDLSGSFYDLKNTLTGNNTVELTVPIDNGEKTSVYYPEITNYMAKGFLSNGVFFNNGLNVSFDKVGYDE